MNTHRTIGLLLIIAGVTLLIPYTMLTIIFEYPDILRQDTSVILHKFHDGGSELIWTWFAFAMTGIPLLPAFILHGVQKLENKTASARLATTLGVIGLIVQIVGLLRWTFVVPVLAETFVNATDDSTKAATILAFKTIHQFAGVLLGEHLGQLFSIAWTVLISFTLLKQKMIPRWLGVFGFIASFIDLLAQAELFATVIPSFPVWDLAGFVGSTLWLIWLIIVGVTFLRKDAPTPRSA